MIFPVLVFAAGKTIQIDSSGGVCILNTLFGMPWTRKLFIVREQIQFVEITTKKITYTEMAEWSYSKTEIFVQQKFGDRILLVQIGPNTYNSDAQLFLGQLTEFLHKTGLTLGPALSSVLVRSAQTE
jgi:hypothetical protein